MRSLRFGALALVLSSGFASSAVADDFTLYGAISEPAFGGYYQLRGQSAFIQLRNGGSTSGNQLDGLSTGEFGVFFNEAFPPADPHDYTTFAYFGLVDTYDSEENLIDTSLVVAMRSGVGEGMTVEDLFPGHSEAELVDALANSFDSDQFNYLYDEVTNRSEFQGDISVPTAGQSGETLDFIAFIYIPNRSVSDSGINIGNLNALVTPAPGAVALAGIAGVFGLRRRR